MVCLLPLLAQAWQRPQPIAVPQQSPPPALQQTQPPASPAPFGAISSYLGLPVSEVRFKGVAEREKDHLRDLIHQKAGKPLDRELVRDSIKLLYDSGLFADIQVEAEKTADDRVLLTFSTVSNY